MKPKKNVDDAFAKVTLENVRIYSTTNFKPQSRNKGRKEFLQ